MKKGFTLIELLIVTTIIGILSAVSFSAIKSGKKNLALSRSVHALATEIRKAQEMAIAMRKIGGNIPAGYGVYIEKPQTVILFADSFSSQRHIYQSSSDTRIDDGFKLEKNVSISSIELILGSSTSNSSKVHIVFDPPYPDTFIKKTPALPEYDEVVIILSNGEGATKKIKVYRSGLISVE
jgi:prepilin-type N-terminal cleavage/methylation domain-containing protein